MKKILLLTTVLFLVNIIRSQDISYNLLYVNKDSKVYAKRESQNIVWVKYEQNEKKQDLNKIEPKIQYRCDCVTNKIQNISASTDFESVDSESIYQLILDYSCSDLKYENFIGEDLAEWRYYIGKYQDNGNYINVWIKSSLNPDKNSLFQDNDVIKATDYKTGEKIDIKYNKEDVSKKQNYMISKFVIDCNNKKIATIVTFYYLEQNNKFAELPKYYNENGFTKINSYDYDENDLYNLLYKNLCFK